MTIDKFRAELFAQFNMRADFEVFFQVVDADGQLHLQKIDEESGYLGRFGPVITCKVCLSSFHSAAVESSAAPVRFSQRLQPGRRQQASPNQLHKSHEQSAAPLFQTTSQAANDLSVKRSPPLVRVPFDDAVPEVPSVILPLDQSAAAPENQIPLSNSMHLEATENANKFEPSQMHPWSMFVDDSETYGVLFQLGRTFPSLRSQLWALLLLLPLHVDLVDHICQNQSCPEMFFGIKTVLEKVYFLSCVSNWKNLPSFCSDSSRYSVFSSPAFAALDTTAALQTSITVATSTSPPSVDWESSFGSLLLSCHLSAIVSVRRETGCCLNSECLS
jgi:hypothetical protein